MKLVIGKLKIIIKAAMEHVLDRSFKSVLLFIFIFTLDFVIIIYFRSFKKLN